MFLKGNSTDLVSAFPPYIVGIQQMYDFLRFPGVDMIRCLPSGYLPSGYRS